MHFGYVTVTVLHNDHYIIADQSDMYFLNYSVTFLNISTCSISNSFNRQRERERERDLCVCVCVCDCMRVRVCFITGS